MNRATRATIRCDACKEAEESLVLALASTVYPNGWFIKQLTTKGAEAITVHFCPQCKLALYKMYAARDAKPA